MGRLLGLLLFVLPPLALWLDHEVVSFLLWVAWTALVIPLCILCGIDYVRNENAEVRSPVLLAVLKIPIALFGLLSFVMGLCLVLWCLYNLLIQRLPEYSGPRTWLELGFGSFGIAFTMLAFGWYLIALAWGHADKPGPWLALDDPPCSEAETTSLERR